MEHKKLLKTISKHKKWLLHDRGGVCANLQGADLQDAKLQDANLHGADLRGADLRYADLQGADLRYADLRCAKLRCANLQDAKLQDANLQGADLQDANLQGADLRYAKLQDAKLQGADICGSTLPNFSITPTEGSFISWKKLADGYIAKIEIPAKSERITSLGSRKCRASYVKTLSIERDGKHIKTANGTYNNKTQYTVGKITRADRFNNDIRIVCSNGIHFFITYEEAKEY